MRYFPMFLDMRGRTALIAGGGEQAAQKARLIGRSEAELAIMAPELCEELAALVASGRARHVVAHCDLEEARAAAIVFAATGCVGLDGVITGEARRAGAVVNVVDRPALCSAFTPAIVDRDPLVVAIGSEGAAPVLAQRVRMRNEAWLDPRLGGFVAAVAPLRPQVAELTPSARAFWRWAYDGSPARRWLDGDEAGALAEIETAIAAGGPPEIAGGGVALVAVPPKGADLLTLRAARRLENADAVAAYPGAPAGLLELVRRDAERLPGADAADLAARAAAGAAVVALLPAPDPALAADLARRGAVVESL